MKEYERNNKYDSYIKDHKENVSKAFNVLIENNLVETSYINKIQELINNHDLSKYSKKEYSQYAIYFNTKEKTDQIKRDFDYAWLHHQINNPHHYQYWILNKDDGEVKALDMPYEYIIEMVCDWFSFSVKKGDYAEIGKFYKDLKKSPNISQNTKKIIEPIIETLIKLKQE